jgi:hypothetical protein
MPILDRAHSDPVSGSNHTPSTETESKSIRRRPTGYLSPRSFMPSFACMLNVDGAIDGKDFTARQSSSNHVDTGENNSSSTTDTNDRIDQECDDNDSHGNSNGSNSNDNGNDNDNDNDKSELPQELQHILTVVFGSILWYFQYFLGIRSFRVCGSTKVFQVYRAFVFIVLVFRLVRNALIRTSDYPYLLTVGYSSVNLLVCAAWLSLVKAVKCDVLPRTAIVFWRFGYALYPDFKHSPDKECLEMFQESKEQHIKVMQRRHTIVATVAFIIVFVFFNVARVRSIISGDRSENLKESMFDDYFYDNLNVGRIYAVAFVFTDTYLIGAAFGTFALFSLIFHLQIVQKQLLWSAIHVSRVEEGRLSTRAPADAVGGATAGAAASSASNTTASVHTDNNHHNDDETRENVDMKEWKWACKFAASQLTDELTRDTEALVAPILTVGWACVVVSFVCHALVFVLTSGEVPLQRDFIISAMAAAVCSFTSMIWSKLSRQAGTIKTELLGVDVDTVDELLEFASMSFHEIAHMRAERIARMKHRHDSEANESYESDQDTQQTRETVEEITDRETRMARAAEANVFWNRMQPAGSRALMRNQLWNRLGNGRFTRNSTDFGLMFDGTENFDVSEYSRSSPSFQRRLPHSVSDRSLELSRINSVSSRRRSSDVKHRYATFSSHRRRVSTGLSRDTSFFDLIPMPSAERDGSPDRPRTPVDDNSIELSQFDDVKTRFASPAPLLREPSLLDGARAFFFDDGEYDTEASSQNSQPSASAEISIGPQLDRDSVSMTHTEHKHHFHSKDKVAVAAERLAQRQRITYMGDMSLTASRVWPVVKSMFLHGALMAGVAVLVAVVRAIVQFPRCISIPGDGMSDINDSACSDTARWARRIESAFFGNGVTISVPFFVIATTLGFNRVRSIWKLWLPFYFVMSVGSLILYSIYGSALWITICQVVLLLASLWAGGFYIGRIYSDQMGLGIPLAACGTIVVFAYSCVRYALVPLYLSRETEKEKLVVLLFAFPPLHVLFTQSLRRMLRRIHLQYRGEIQHLYVFDVLLDVLLVTIARSFLANVDDFSTQITAVILYNVVRLIIRASAPFFIYAGWMLVTLFDSSFAYRRAELWRTSVLTAHQLYFDQVIEVYGIVFALSFYYGTRVYYGLSYPSVALGVLSLVLQLFGEIVSDIAAVMIEESYLDIDLVHFWSRHQRSGRYRWATIPLGLGVMFLVQFDLTVISVAGNT